MGQSIRIGRIFGVQIGLHPSWFVIAVIVTYTVAAGQLPVAYPNWDQALYWVVGAVIAILFFGSVLAHELSHALVARRFGLKVR
ncbi:MAG TPA: peptidase M50, partial [Candidatus Dormibacteraeota bacterium]